MTQSNTKKYFLLLALLILLPVFFTLLPNHPFTKKLHAQCSAKLEVDKTTIIDKSNHKTLVLDGVDGPYLFTKGKTTTMVNVVKKDSNFQIVKKKIVDKFKQEFTCYVANETNDQFTFQLRKAYKVPPYEYPQPDKLMAISDFEGNFNAFYSLLIANEVMDTAYNWTYGNGRLVIAGDMMDRGVNVTQCLWLIYKLEQSAELVGGQVHFILGNHEVMNLRGIIDYVEPKYVALAMGLSKKKHPRTAYLSLMSKNQELVKWMRSKNVIEKIGDLLFVHGGISSEVVQSNLSLKKINQIARRILTKNYALVAEYDERVQLINGSKGPLWYRGMAIERHKDYVKATPTEVQAVLKKFDVNHIVIGHTPMLQMNMDYEGGVVKINLLQPKVKFSGLAKAFLVENENFYIVNDLGIKKILK